MHRFVGIIACYTILLLGFNPPAQAFPNFPTDIDAAAKNLYGAAASYTFKCDACHDQGFALATQFGVDYKDKAAQLYPNTNPGVLAPEEVQAIIQGMELLDSDNDGANTKAELIGGTNPGDPASTPAPVCVKNDPTLTIDPSSQTGEPGQTKVYSLSLTNNDVDCPDSTFTLNSIVAAPLSAQIDLQMATLKPGESATASISITSAAAAQDGSYAFMVDATDNADANRKVLVQGDYIVKAAAPVCVRNSPALVIDPASQMGEPGQAKVYNINLTNNDVDCLDSNFSLVANVAAPLSAQLAAQSLLAKSGETVSTTISVSSDAAAQDGSYGFSVDASQADPARAAQAQASYVVKAAPVCVRNNPTVALDPASQNSLNGAKISYKVSVTNNDSAACLPTTFDLSLALAAELLGTLNVAQLTLAPGASADANAELEPKVDSATGSYNFTANASDPKIAGHAGSAQGTLVVVSDKDVTAPTAPSGFSGKQKGKAIAISWGASSDDVGVVKYSVWLNGAIVAETSRTRARIPGAKGVHKLYITAHDAAGNSSAASNEITIDFVPKGK